MATVDSLRYIYNMIDLLNTGNLGLPDTAALAYLLIGWFGIGYLVENPPAKRPSVAILMNSYRREWMRQFVIENSTPPSLELPAPNCRADELEEEGLSLAEFARATTPNFDRLFSKAAAWTRARAA